MPRIKRTFKTLTRAERAERERELALIEAEKPELDAWANKVLDRMEAIENVVAALRAARMRKNLSLSQVDDASGLGRSNICRLETSAEPNPTLETLLTLAEAIGVELRIALVDKDTGELIPIKNNAA